MLLLSLQELCLNPSRVLLGRLSSFTSVMEAKLWTSLDNLKVDLQLASRAGLSADFEVSAKRNAIEDVLHNYVHASVSRAPFDKVPPLRMRVDSWGGRLLEA
jgi:hypothetical protein